MGLPLHALVLVAGGLCLSACGTPDGSARPASNDEKNPSFSAGGADEGVAGTKAAATGGRGSSGSDGSASGGSFNPGGGRGGLELGGAGSFNSGGGRSGSELGGAGSFNPDGGRGGLQLGGGGSFNPDGGRGGLALGGGGSFNPDGGRGGLALGEVSGSAGLGEPGGAPATGASGAGGSSGALSSGGNAGNATGGTGGAASECVPSEAEVCDAEDNDCDGEVDEGEVCPDSTVKNTEPFTSSVYCSVSTQGFTGLIDAIQRCWPTVGKELIRPDLTGVAAFFFRATDAALFYTAAGTAFQYMPGPEPQIDVPSPAVPCFSSDGVSKYWNPRFGFDAQNQVYYQCENKLYRGSGQLITKPVDGEPDPTIAELVGVFPDGRTLVIRNRWFSFSAKTFVVLDANGRELARLDTSEFSGNLVPSQSRATIFGNHAYVILRRDQPRELVVYRIDESNTWKRVRRVPDNGADANALVTPDGTLFVRRFDGTKPAGQSSSIVARTAAGEIVVWQMDPNHAADSHPDFSTSFAVGP